jgi:hypothetical protein
VRGNKAYLNELLTDTDIVLVQEHWLWQFESNFWEENVPGYDSHSRSCDMFNLATPVVRGRARGGTAILWKQDLSPFITRLEDGNDRVVCIELATSSARWCLICVYMPTQGQSSAICDLEEHFDILHEILAKYPDHNILLAGDFNSSMIRDRQQDQLLQRFVREHALEWSTEAMGKNPTYVHHMLGTEVTSQIDYVFIRGPSRLLQDVVISESGACTSLHRSVRWRIHVCCGVKARDSVRKNKSPIRKIQWDRANPEALGKTFLALLPCDLPSNGNITVLEAAPKAIATALVQAAQLTVPSKLVKLKGPSLKLSPELALIVDKSKSAFWEWKREGRPGPGHHLSTAMREGKKAVRHQQRLEAREERTRFYHAMMTEVNNRNFFKLIRKQRGSNSMTSAVWVENELSLDSHVQTTGWAKYFETLGFPKTKPNYDEEYSDGVKMEVKHIESIASSVSTGSAYTELEVAAAIDKLNSGKAPDELGVVAEHLKVIKSTVTPVVTQLLNDIRNLKYVPSCMKSGIITPVGKKGKDLKCMDNYRGITISALLGKVLEHVLLARKPSQQADLQYGFTKGLSPKMASLILRECIVNSRENREPLYVCTLDAVKAFDTVSHASLLVKLYREGIDMESWAVIKSLYEDMTARVKWKDKTSTAISINQGVRQGGVLSPSLYKTYINNLLLEIEASGCGFRIGTTFVGSPGVADDIMCIAPSPPDLQSMLTIAGDYADRERYDLHPTKSEITQFSSSRTPAYFTWDIAGTSKEVSESITHLGMDYHGCLTRGHHCGPWVKDKLAMGRRAVYGLMGTGLHGSNGIGPATSVVIYRCYVLSRLLYGLEVAEVNITQMKTIRSQHLTMVRRFQSLHDRTATCAVYLLAGMTPIDGEIDILKLGLLGQILRSGNRTMQDILTYQYASRPPDSNSWFVQTARLLLQYGLPTLNQLCEWMPSKEKWKRQVKCAVYLYWTKQLHQECEERSTLLYFNVSGVCGPDQAQTHF